jgi:hypothetical protein
VTTKATDTTTSAEILLKAADVIERNGHHKGDFANLDEIWKAEEEEGIKLSRTDCPVCTRGAINIVVAGDPDDCGSYGSFTDSAAQSLADHLGLESTVDVPSEHHVIGAIAEWNDAPERTAEQVVTALRECAAQLQAGAK